MISVEKAGAADAPEILALQKLAFQSEAELYHDDAIPPLTQTLADLSREIQTVCVLKAVEDGHIIGSVRGEIIDGVGHINRLMVDPQNQKQGLGTRLLLAMEKELGTVGTYQLGTGHLSAGNLRLYQALGYREIRREPLTVKVTFIIMQKPGSGA